MIKSISIDIENGIASITHGTKDVSNTYTLTYAIKDMDINLFDELKPGELYVTNLGVSANLCEKPIRVIR